ncbi:ATP-binding protein [Nocardiopsis ganjiahuensis]|uniref:ATP-binding protein n=1 Tax=Nocardiopsis ganjiahuensis TaxID=239984 RepID=UPI000348B340|nr:ATP-binding protein [Nocardiopsis ganjiahuensis]
MNALLTKLPAVTLPLIETVPSRSRHYFDPDSGRAPYRVRHYEFASSVHLMPLVRAFLDTAAAHRGRDYRYLFTLLGNELAANALAHTRSGLPLGHYTLTCERRRDGLRLTCQDQGVPGPFDPDRPQHLKVDSRGLNPEATSGRGLAMINALSASWGDNGLTRSRRVWFHLPYDQTRTLWNRLGEEH